VDAQLSYIYEDDTHKQRMAGDEVIADYGNTTKGKILKRIEFKSIIAYVKREQISFVYVRYDHNANPFTIYLMRCLKKIGVRIACEIPTYPYDQEYKGLPAPYQRTLFIDKLFRKRFAKYVDKFVTFSDYTEIWGRPTIHISNGIDFEQIKIKSRINDTCKEFHLLGVATMHPWHGFDRAIRGLIEYNRQSPTLTVYLHLVGYGVPELVDSYKQLVEDGDLGNKVIFHSALYGDELDRMFDIADFGVGSLARHRSGITIIKTLKNREYAARGIPFVYSEIDEDFEKMPYIFKAPADDTPLDIQALIDFYRSIDVSPANIRASIEKTLSWKVQMQRVLNEI
jgi:glycosyltransferase involved in cell wall biosynthesis